MKQTLKEAYQGKAAAEQEQLGGLTAAERLAAVKAKVAAEPALAENPAIIKAIKKLEDESQRKQRLWANQVKQFFQ